eukprot:scaffold230969_cov35-Tisochrysis_lutea.AAC.2
MVMCDVARMKQKYSSHSHARTKEKSGECHLGGKRNIPRCATVVTWKTGVGDEKVRRDKVTVNTWPRSNCRRRSGTYSLPSRCPHSVPSPASRRPLEGTCSWEADRHSSHHRLQ